MPQALVEPCVLAGCPEGGTVLDPFGGSGTVSLVAKRLGRSSVYIDANAKYRDMAVQRVRGENLEIVADEYEMREVEPNAESAVP